MKIIQLIFLFLITTMNCNAMYLSHTTIEKYINNGSIVIGPNFDKNNIRPVGIRIHLGRYLLIPIPGQTVDLTQAKDLLYKTVDLTQEEFYLEPGEFVLGATYETIQTTPDILAILDGRSTIARLGITTHVTASIIDGTFGAPHAPTLELKNVGNFKIRLKEKDPIAMMLFAKLEEPVTQQLQSQYRYSQTTSTVMPPNLQFKTGSDK